MSKKIFDDFVNSLQFNPEITQVKSARGYWINTDKASAETLLNAAKKMELLSQGVTLSQLSQIKSAVKWRQGNLMKERQETLQKALATIDNPFEYGILVRLDDRNPDHPKALRFLDKETLCEIPGNAEQKLLAVKRIYRDMVEEKIANAPRVNLIFDITKPFGFGPKDKYNTFELNTYRPQDLSHVKDVPLNPLFKEFMENLIPVKYEEQWVCSWLAHATTSTCDTLLLLVGDMGTGKSTLMFLASTFHRHETVEVIRGTGMNSRFNANLEGKRLNCIDEFVCKTSESKANFKALFNTLVSIEAKGVDARKGKIYISHIATTNSTTDVHLEARDRRVSVPDLNQAPIPPHIGAFIVPLGKRIADNSLTESDWEDIKAFQKYVFENQLPDFKSYMPLKGEMFREMCENSMGEVLYMVFAALRDAPGILIPYCQLKAAWDKKPAQAGKPNFPKFSSLISRINFYIRENEKLIIDKGAKALAIEIKEIENV